MALLVFNHVVVFPYDKSILSLLKEGTESVTSWDFFKCLSPYLTSGTDGSSVCIFA